MTLGIIGTTPYTPATDTPSPALQKQGQRLPHGHRVRLWWRVLAPSVPCVLWAVFGSPWQSIAARRLVACLPRRISRLHLAWRFEVSGVLILACRYLTPACHQVSPSTMQFTRLPDPHIGIARAGADHRRTMRIAAVLIWPPAPNLRQLDNKRHVDTCRCLGTQQTLSVPTFYG